MHLRPALLVCSLACACASEEAAAPASTDAAAADASEDVVEETPSSYYDFTIVMPSGLQQKLKDEILPQYISFGCTHLPPPVKSLAVELTFTKPFAVMSMNLGFVIGDEGEYPLTIDDVGNYDWGKDVTNAPPGFKLVTKDGAGGPQYTLATWPSGASGQYTILEWGTTAGKVVEGTIEGTLQNADGAPATATISGKFRILLPPEEGCGR